MLIFKRPSGKKVDKRGYVDTINPSSKHKSKPSETEISEMALFKEDSKREGSPQKLSQYTQYQTPTQ